MKTALKYASVYGLGYIIGGCTVGVWFFRVLNAESTLRRCTCGRPHNRYDRVSYNKFDR